MGHRRRRRCGSFAMASLLAVAQAASPIDCPASCSSDASPCALSAANGAIRECFTAADSEPADEWRVALDTAQGYSCDGLELPPEVQTMTLRGDKTRVQFTDASKLTGDRLTALLFIGLDLANSSLPELPETLSQLEIINCALPSIPVAKLLQLPKLKRVVMTDITLTQSMTELSEQQFTLLSSRTVNTSTNWWQTDGPNAVQVTDCTQVRGGRVESLGGLPVCVIPDAVAVGRRLQTSIGSGYGAESGTGSSSADDHDRPTLVLLSMGLPFLYFLYKLGLFIFFSRTWKQDRLKNNAPVVAANAKSRDIAAPKDSEVDRPTTNASSTSPPSTPTPRAHRRQDKKPFSSNNADFWVDEELQSWRLDFQRIKLLKSIKLVPNEKRQTLRKQSVTSANNPREIWLASYASGRETTGAVSPGGGTTDSLVVAKFLSPKDGQSIHSPSAGSGSGGARGKLKGELMRQAMFSHPQVVAFIGVAWSRETQLVAVTEYMPQGDLRQWLHRTSSRQAGKWTVLKVRMLLDVTRALLYLHSMHPRLVHGNCNSRNVLLDRALRAKLSDFGVHGRSDCLSEEDLMSYSAVGSGRWISPEALLGRETSAAYPDAGDVYSLGILIAEVDSHELPFSDLMQANRSAVPETDILQLIAKGALSPTLSPTCPKSIVKLVNACTSYNPKYRPSSAQVQQDLLRILEDFREFESKTTATISVGAPRSNPPSNLV